MRESLPSAAAILPPSTPMLCSRACGLATRRTQAGRCLRPHRSHRCLMAGPTATSPRRAVRLTRKTLRRGRGVSFTPERGRGRSGARFRCSRSLGTLAFSDVAWRLRPRSSGRFPRLGRRQFHACAPCLGPLNSTPMCVSPCASGRACSSFQVHRQPLFLLAIVECGIVCSLRREWTYAQLRLKILLSSGDEGKLRLTRRRWR